MIITTPPEGFKGKGIQFIFQDDVEIKAFHSIFNHITICNFIREYTSNEDAPKEIRKALDAQVEYSLNLEAELHYILEKSLEE